MLIVSLDRGLATAGPLGKKRAPTTCLPAMLSQRRAAHLIPTFTRLTKPVHELVNAPAACAQPLTPLHSPTDYKICMVGIRSCFKHLKLMP
jgi:hypothetical protein